MQGCSSLRCGSDVGRCRSSGCSCYGKRCGIAYRAGPPGTSLSPGRVMVVQASVPQGSWCRLSLRHPGASSRSSTPVRARSALAQFEWTVPRDVAAGQWKAQVACARSRSALVRGRASGRGEELLRAPARRGKHDGPGAASIHVTYPISGAQPLTGKGGGSYPPVGALLIAGSAWLDGHGVNVYSDGADGGDGYYQCVELVNRLITTLHWSPAIYGNANQFWADASSAYSPNTRTAAVISRCRGISSYGAAVKAAMVTCRS